MDLRTIIHAFRKSLEEQHAQGRLPPGWEDFPSGCCGASSKILADYLKAQLGVQAEYVCGDLDGQTHAWLEFDGNVIDITGDQFAGRPPVFISPRDRWYCSWEDIVRSDADGAPSGRSSSETRLLLQTVIRETGLPNPYG